MGQLVALVELSRAGRARKLFVLDGRLSGYAVRNLLERPLLSGRFPVGEISVGVGDVVRHQVEELGVLGAVVDGEGIAGDGPEVAQTADEVAGQTCIRS